MGRQDGPEHIPQRNRLRSALPPIVVIAVLLPYSFSVGATGATFTLVNRTGYYLHAVVNNKSSVYIAPGSVVTYDVSRFASIAAEVRYSPGQDVKGSAIRSFPIVVHSSSVSKTSNDCNKSENCSSTTESSGTQSADPVTWTVTEEDLQPN
jgi:hypothetical protein